MSGERDPKAARFPADYQERENVRLRFEILPHAIRAYALIMEHTDTSASLAELCEQIYDWVKTGERPSD